MGKSKKRPLLPIIVMASGVVILIAAVASIFLFSGGDQPAAANNTGGEIPLPQISRVDVTTAKNALDSGQAVIVDVRDRIYYEQEHIAGAISIPLAEIESRLGELNQSDWIILYCT